MNQTLLNIFIPPLAICRYGSAACCIYPVSGFWVGGIALLAYHFTTSHHINVLTELGSLYGGIAMILISIVWTRLTLKKVASDEGMSARRRNTICNRILPNPQERDPLEETIKARKEA